MSLDIAPVASTRDLDTFIRLPWTLYRGDPNFVPPLRTAERRLLDPRRNPFWAFASAGHFLARRDGRVVGRISAIHNPRHLEFQGEKAGFFGFFECERDPEAARSLLGAAESWVRERGDERLRGPVNPSLNDPCGLLVEGFDRPPVVMMTYNPPWYAELIERAGYSKAMDLLAHSIVPTGVVVDKVHRLAERVRERSGVSLRRVDLKRFREELALVIDIYNDAWSRNWGFVPMTPEEIRFSADDLKAILMPELVVFAEIQGRPAGFGLALPDINPLLQKCNGRLFPFGWLRFLPGSIRRVPQFRIVALGVKKEHQAAGIGTVFYDHYIRVSQELGFRLCEMSWILETNDLMNRPLELIGTKVYKRYRLYDKTL